MSFKPIRPLPTATIIEPPKPIAAPTPPVPLTPIVASHFDLPSSSPKVGVSFPNSSVTNPPKQSLSSPPSTSAIQLDLPAQGIETFVNKVMMFNRGQVSKDLFMESLRTMFPMLQSLPDVNVEIKLNFFSNEARQMLSEGRQPQPSLAPIQSVIFSQPEPVPQAELSLNSVDELDFKVKKIRKFWICSKDSYPFTFKKSFYFITKSPTRKFELEIVNLDQTLSNSKINSEGNKPSSR